MVVNWFNLIAPLRAAMRDYGVALPIHPATDARWHLCEPGDTAYLLFITRPPCALYRRADRPAGVWREDHFRLMSLAEERRIKDALSSAPTLSKRSGVDPSVRTSKQRPASVEADESPSPKVHPKSLLEAAKTLLIATLADGPVPTVAVQLRAEAAGFSWATVRRAAAALGIEAVRMGFGSEGSWSWRLPRTPSVAGT